MRITETILAALVLGCVTTHAGDVVIQSFDRPGQLAFNTLATGVAYRVEWSPSPAGPWTNFAAASAALDWIAATGMGAITAAVPMCYRVVAAVTNGGPAGDYLIVDLSSGPSALSYPISYLTAIPEGGWTDEYKTTRLVLRRIPAGTFTMGAPTNELGYFGPGNDDERQHEVTLTQPFYLGVFEVTQKQWERVMGSWPSYFSNTTCRDSRPVESVRNWYGDIRGYRFQGAWPTNNEVDTSSFMGRLRMRTGRSFDLPTEAQWEYAGRAGTATALNSGLDLTDILQCSNLSALARYQYTQGAFPDSTVNTSAGTAKVGSYQPNGWGLYDMHGNVEECCLDWYGAYPQSAVDPKGPLHGDAALASPHVRRGGSFSDDAHRCRSAKRIRSMDIPDFVDTRVGFRVALPSSQ